MFCCSMKIMFYTKAGLIPRLAVCSFTQKTKQRKKILFLEAHEHKISTNRTILMETWFANLTVKLWTISL